MKRVLLVVLIAIVCGIAIRKFKAGCKFNPDPEIISKYSTEVGTVLITGANIGLGLETARSLVGLGVHVILACRNMTACSNARQSILQQNPVEGVSKLGRVDMEEMDLLSLHSVRDCAQRVISRYPDLRVLVNNAGIFGAPMSVNAEGVETHFAVNYLSHFLLTSILLPHMKKAGGQFASHTPGHVPVRVIEVSSRMHEILPDQGINFDAPGFLVAPDAATEMSSNYSWINAYGQSKLAMILHAHELARREKDSVLAVSLHPGVVGTAIARYEHPYLNFLFTHFLPLFISKSPEEGSQPILHCILDQSLSKVPLKNNGAFFVDCEMREVVWPRFVSEDVDGVALRLWKLSEELLSKSGV